MLELFELAIYVLQQFGVMLGVGAQTVLLCTTLLIEHHGATREPHGLYARAARMGLRASLVAIVISGAGAVLFHLALQEGATLMQPAFLFKWILIAGLVALQVRSVEEKLRSAYSVVAGGTWYALFLVHSLGPVTSWTLLWALYIAWMIFFAASWAGFAGIMQRMKGRAPEDSSANEQSPVIQS